MFQGSLPDRDHCVQSDDGRTCDDGIPARVPCIAEHPPSDEHLACCGRFDPEISGRGIYAGIPGHDGFRLGRCLVMKPVPVGALRVDHEGAVTVRDYVADKRRPEEMYSTTAMYFMVLYSTFRLYGLRSEGLIKCRCLTAIINSDLACFMLKFLLSGTL